MDREKSTAKDINSITPMILTAVMRMAILRCKCEMSSTVVVNK